MPGDSERAWIRTHVDMQWTADSSSDRAGQYLPVRHTQRLARAGGRPVGSRSDSCDNALADALDAVRRDRSRPHPAFSPGGDSAMSSRTLPG